jgi:hypothetical protein
MQTLKQTFTATRKPPGRLPYFQHHFPSFPLSSLSSYTSAARISMQPSPSVSLWSQAYIKYMWHRRRGSWGYLEVTFFIDLIRIIAASGTYSYSDKPGLVAPSSKQRLVDTVSIIICTKSSENRWISTSRAIQFHPEPTLCGGPTSFIYVGYHSVTLRR